MGLLDLRPVQGIGEAALRPDGDPRQGAGHKGGLAVKPEQLRVVHADRRHNDLQFLRIGVHLQGRFPIGGHRRHHPVVDGLLLLAELLSAPEHGRLRVRIQGRPGLQHRRLPDVGAAEGVGFLIKAQNAV